MTQQDTQPPAETHPCWSKRLNRRAHRHWATYAGLQPTCERCGTLIDREHKEIGPVCWTRPVKPGEALVPIWREVQDIHSAAMRDDVTPDEYRTRMIAALTRRAGGDAIPAGEEWPVKWAGPLTVGNMIANLRTLPADMPIHSAYHLVREGKPARLFVKHPTVSRERVDGREIKTGDESVPYSAVIWSHGREPEIATPKPPAGGDAGAAEERDALLTALGWKTGPFRDALSRKVILDDCAALRPEMVKARQAAQDAQSRAQDYHYLLGEYVHGSRSGVLGRLWEEVKRLRSTTPKPPAGGDEWSMVNRLRDQEADSVEILCDNPDGDPNNAIVCCGFWTGFVERRFSGDTIADALRSAVEAKDQADRDGHPDVLPAGGDAVMTAALNQNDAMRQELAHVGNLVSDLARAMKVDQANDDGTWPDLAGRIQRLIAAIPKSPAGGDAGAVEREKIREALTPFAQWADWYEGMALTDEAVAHGMGRINAPPSYILVADLRRARSILAALALPAPVVEGEVQKLRDTLRDLEAACDDLAANRSRETYHNMIHCDRATPYLEALDEARRNARAALTEGRSHG